LLDIAALHHAAGGILRRIENDEFGAVGDEGREFAYVEREIVILAQLDGHGLAADVVDHRLINGEAGVGINDLIFFINQRHYGEENNRLTSGNDDHFLGCDSDSASAADIVGDGLAKFGQACGRAVVSPTMMEGVDGGFDYVGGVSKSGSPISRWIMLLP